MRTPDEENLRSRHKAELRRRMLAVRGATPKEAREERTKRATELARSLEWEGVQTVASFSAIRGEMDTRRLEDWLRERGIRIAYPCIDHSANELVLRLAKRDELEEATFGLLEPKASCPIIEQVDRILVPALAIDPRGHRIGYGRGYYDRLLASIPNAERVGFVYDFQLVAEAPNQAGDIPVHKVVTDTRILECQGAE
ncbi:MAG: 5-formyltetrahydrofolate cyclo-ligase [Polyangiales bacterium]|jgi:5-formyltetrahydrofolate cyclo-ligase